jgi:hypothetical protein
MTDTNVPEGNYDIWCHYSQRTPNHRLGSRIQTIIENARGSCTFSCVGKRKIVLEEKTKIFENDKIIEASEYTINISIGFGRCSKCDQPVYVYICGEYHHMHPNNYLNMCHDCAHVFMDYCFGYFGSFDDSVTVNAPRTIKNIEESKAKEPKESSLALINTIFSERPNLPKYVVKTEFLLFKGSDRVCAFHNIELVSCRRCHNVLYWTWHNPWYITSERTKTKRLHYYIVIKECYRIFESIPYWSWSEKPYRNEYKYKNKYISLSNAIKITDKIEKFLDKPFGLNKDVMGIVKGYLGPNDKSFNELISSIREDYYKYLRDDFKCPCELINPVRYY